MGILSKLKDKGTLMKLLKYGADTQGGGNSGQPFIQKEIPENYIPKEGEDQILRGGFKAPINALTDVARLTRYLFNPKSTNGVLFVAKQNILSRIAPKTETTFGSGYAGGLINEGIYTPLSTLAQAGVGFAGAHLYKQDLNPLGEGNGSINKYGNVISNQFKNIEDGNWFQDNRLIKAYNTHIEPNNSEEQTFLYSYSGGPGSTLGIGRTYIKFATDGTNENPLRTGIWNKNFNSPYSTNINVNDSTESNQLIYTGYQNTKLRLTKENETIGNPSPISNILKSYDRELLSPIKFIEGNTWYATSTTNKISNLSSYNTLFNDGTSNYQTYDFGIKPNSQGYLANQDRNAGIWIDPKSSKPVFILNAFPRGINQDFRKTPREKRGFTNDTQGEQSYNNKILSSSTEYLDKEAKPKNTVDQIYYLSTNSSFKTSTPLNSTNDLIQFRIEILDVYDPKDTTKTEKLNFRAYIDNLSDSYNPEWYSQTYMGRGEKFHRFKSFDRDISLGFTIVADNEKNLDTMYRQLNTLAASLTPNYGNSGYMAGNIHKLTIGNYIHNQYGIIQGLTFDINNETPWEIKDGKQLPLYIKVTGLKFTPIHNFRPEYQPFIYTDPTKSKSGLKDNQLKLVEAMIERNKFVNQPSEK